MTTSAISPQNSLPISLLLDLTLEDQQTNFFINHLLYCDRQLAGSNPFTPEDVREVIDMYMLATVPLWFARFAGGFGGACIFPYVDTKCYTIRAIEAKCFDQFNNETGSELYNNLLARQSKVTGDPVPGWMVDYQFNKTFCLFGAHLLKQHRQNPIAVVSDPVSAIYGTLYFGLPKTTSDLLWMATGPGGLTYDKCNSLRGRTVMLFPDAGLYQDWTEKIDKWSEYFKKGGTTFTISDLLQKAPGMMSDYLRQYDWKEFRAATKEDLPTPTIQPTATQYHGSVREWHHEPLIDPKPIVTIPGAWDSEIAELEAFFTDQIPPDLETARSNNGNPVFRPYLDRVIGLKESQRRMGWAMFKVKP